MNEIAKPLLICLVAAHFVGDFILQSDKDASNKLKPLTLLKHSFIVALLSYVFCGVWIEWRIPLAILTMHGVIDFVKARLKKQGVYSFLLDQATHIVAISMVAMLIAPAGATITDGFSLFWVDLFGIGFLKLLIVLSGAIVGVKAGGILIGLAVQPFLDQLEKNEEKRSSRGFENGGKVIGQLERSLIFLFILMGQPAGIGFLIAAKSVFRFGEIKDHHHRMEAEYIIIGTLMSFGYGMLVAYATKFFLEQI